MKKLFTKKTRFNDFVDMIEWEDSLEYYFEEDNLKKRINDLETSLNLLTQGEKIKLLNSELKKIVELQRRNSQPIKIETKVKGKIIPVRKCVNNYSKLISSIYSEYKNGNRPPLKFFRLEIEEYVNSYLETINYDPDIFLQLDVKFTRYSNVKYGISLEDASYYIIDFATLGLIADEIFQPVKYKDYLEKRLKILTKSIQSEKKQKLTWIGKPAHLALIIDLLVDKGYLKTSNYGERTASILLSIIEIEGFKTDIEGLGKLLHKDNYPIKDKTVIDRFYRIPNRNELK